MWVYCDDTTDRWSDGHRFLNSSSTFDTWLKGLIDKGWAKNSEFGGGYTYNDENALSQDIVWHPFVLTDDCPWVEYSTEMMAVSIHGGCDARGGFTDYRMFEIDGHDGVYSFLDYSDCSVSWSCDKQIDPNQLVLDGVPPETGPHYYAQDFRGGYAEWYNHDSGSSDEPEQLDADEVAPHDEFGCARRCHCGGVLAIDGFYAPTH
jgi:hypothetical protein